MNERKSYQEYKKQPKRRKNRKLRRALLAITMPFIMIFLILTMLFISMASVMPSIADGMVDDYKVAAELVGCTWQELLVYDTVRFDNDLEDVDPFLSAVDFLKLHFEKWIWVETDDGGYWKEVQSGDLVSPSSICSWLTIPTESDIRTILDAGKRVSESGSSDVKWIIQFSNKDLDELIIEKEFDEDQIEWVDMLMTAGILDEMFGDLYDLPDYIDTTEGGYFAWPTPELHTVTSKFASVRVHPVLGIKRAHNGVDISGSNAMGSPVIAIEDGTVIYVNLSGGERGINIKVQHKIGDDIWISRYQHLSAAKVEVGDEVKLGTVIGGVGNTGIGTGPHLHIEITYNGVLIDPLSVIQ
ncbi:M23 family metallopeptidase [Sinanaerobacter sp. ZZT-01]|uniref:M23 family metallopeptidase n=1 Tax=Sinanaerobacter sp. ZZT-01 TaxID=3111540 RepID=UPI002D79F87E|nr:M23 family metallopeptidase [Sinanaerobacter sp. ZZT-01]WRR94185.1 M23 family metallopeptidase [Sinanaerobacter sp. ZZT-01]